MINKLNKKLSDRIVIILFLLFNIWIFILLNPISFASSVLPGWHVTIYPPHIIYTLIILLVSALLCFTYLLASYPVIIFIYLILISTSGLLYFFTKVGLNNLDPDYLLNIKHRLAYQALFGN